MTTYGTRYLDEATAIHWHLYNEERQRKIFASREVDAEGWAWGYFYEPEPGYCKEVVHLYKTDQLLINPREWEESREAVRRYILPRKHQQ